MDIETARMIGRILGLLLISWIVWRATDGEAGRCLRWFPWSPIHYESEKNSEEFDREHNPK